MEAPKLVLVIAITYKFSFHFCFLFALDTRRIQISALKKETHTHTYRHTYMYIYISYNIVISSRWLWNYQPEEVIVNVWIVFKKMTIIIVYIGKWAVVNRIYKRVIYLIKKIAVMQVSLWHYLYFQCILNDNQTILSGHFKCLHRTTVLYLLSFLLPCWQNCS